MAKKKKTGRKKKKLKLTESQIMELAGIGCTNLEIASLAGMDNSGLEKRFSKILTKGREGGKIRLRRLQWKSATKGSDRMLRWLGIQLLGQTDKVDTNIKSDSRELKIIVGSKKDAQAIEDAVEKSQ